MTTFLVKAENGKEFEYDNRPDAEAHVDKIESQFGVGAEIVVEGTSTDGGAAVVDEVPDEPSVTEDPVSWMPDHFIDSIQGVPVVNRKGYAVIASKYGVSVTAEPVTLPNDTEFQYAAFRAIATDADGNEYSGFGSAHVDRDDDKMLLAELAETRAMKRATSWATGVGMTAASELMGDLEGEP